MLARNESGRYLARSLLSLEAAVDRIVVLDDASTDDTAEVCRQLGAEVRSRPSTGFAEEWRLRDQLWRWACSLQPEWIVVLDADEVLRGGSRLRDILMSLPGGVAAAAVRLWDLWDDEDSVRDDELWTAHRRHWVVAMRYRPGWPYLLRRQGQHCGRLPLDPPGRIAEVDGVDILHFGWLRPSDRRLKAARYKRLDPGARWGSAAQYASILDPEPRRCRVPPLPALQVRIVGGVGMCGGC